MSTSSTSRRTFLGQAAIAGAAVASWPLCAAGRASGMKVCLVGGSIGVRADQRESIELAARHRFDAVEPKGDYLANLTSAQLDELKAELKAKRLVWGQAGLPVNFRGSRESLQAGLHRLPRIANALHEAGVDRMGTWLSPAHSALTYVQNFRLHAANLRETAKVLSDHGLRLGLEYVGTHTLLIGRKYPFIHTLAETLDLIDEIGANNVGIVADSWHWWQAEDTIEQLTALSAEQVVSVDLNDAPAGIPKREQIDGQRELPATTGVIDMRAFLGALAQIGFSGPMRAEPFNRKLNEMNNDDACAATVTAMRRAIALLD